jgi:cell division protein FtsN
MPLSRPVLLALIGAVLALATFFATSAARQGTTASKADPAAQAARAKKAAAAATPAKPAVKKTAAKAPAKPAPAKAKPVKAKPVTPTPAKPKVVGVPAPVARALDKKRVVVLFFRQSGSADDRAVAGAVNAQRGRKGVSVFSDSIARLARYRAVIGSLGISQAPAVVIVGRNGEAQVVEGFVDEGSLTQQVVDAK